MTLLLKQNISVIAPGVLTPFFASGGTAPYTYSIQAGGAGGSIDVNGLYTAPLSMDADGEIDTIIVTDNLSATASLPISVLTPLRLVCSIIETELGLNNGQVYIYNQKFNIPKDNSLRVAVGVISMKPFSNINRSEDNGAGGLRQVQVTNIKALLSIDIFSKGTIALERKEEVVMSLNGNYSKRVQEANSFAIASLPMTFVNLSAIDGVEIPYQYNLSINMQYSVKKISNIEHFETFNEPTVITNK